MLIACVLHYQTLMNRSIIILSQVNRLHKEHMAKNPVPVAPLPDLGLKFKDSDYQCSSDSELSDVMAHEESE